MLLFSGLQCLVHWHLVEQCLASLGFLIWFLSPFRSTPHSVFIFFVLSENLHAGWLTNVPLYPISLDKFGKEVHWKSHNRNHNLSWFLFCCYKFKFALTHDARSLMISVQSFYVLNFSFWIYFGYQISSDLLANAESRLWFFRVIVVSQAWILNKWAA